MSDSKIDDIWKCVVGKELEIAKQLRDFGQVLPASLKQRTAAVAKQLERSVQRGPGLSCPEAHHQLLAGRDAVAIVSPLLERAARVDSGDDLTAADLVSDLQIGVCRLQRSDNDRSSLIGPFVYPGVLTAGLIGLLAIFSTYLMPEFTSVLEEFGIPIPKPTQFLLSICWCIETAWPLVWLGALLTLLPMVVELCRFSGCALSLVRWLDRRLEGKRLALAAWAEHAALLLQSGIPQDSAVATAMRSSRRWLRNGHWPWRFGLLEQALKLGDTSAKVALLNQTADYYRARHRSWVQWWSGFLPSALLCLLGGFLTFAIVSIIMPLFAILSGLSGGVN